MQELEYWKLTQANGKKCTHQTQLAVEQQWEDGAKWYAGEEKRW